MNLQQIIRLISLTFYVILVYCQQHRQKKYNVLNDLKISQSYQTLYGIDSTLECAARCLHDGLCTSANYNKAENICELTNQSPEDGPAGVTEDQNWNILYFKNQEWNLIFRATAGIGIPTYSAYMGTTGLPTPSDACKLPQTLDCTTHYRDSNVIDSWNTHNIQEVKFVLYKAGVAVVNITFSNSVSDDKTSWFKVDHIISSSYGDLNPETQCNYFSISGAAHLHRRFHINEKWKGCPSDVGWVCVFDVDMTGSGETTCPYELGIPHPSFAYLPNNKKGFFATDLQMADVLAIYTKM